MSSFQDDAVRRREKFVVAGSSASLLLLIVVGTVVAICTDPDDGTDLSTRSMHSTSKSVQMICSSTDYRSTCESSLSKVIAENSTDPKDILKAAISVVIDEASRAFGQSRLLKSNDSEVRAAMEDCRVLFDDVKQDLERSLGSIVGNSINRIDEHSHDWETWMSAVMTFEEACIDGFPEGEAKRKMKAAMSKAKEMSSNAIAIIGQVRSFLSMLEMPGLSRRRRRLLDTKDGIPSWVEGRERRILTGKSKLNIKPNVTVAKDGSGDFTTISAALAAMPERYEARYVIYVKAGIYEETVNVTRKMVNLTMYGDGSKKSIITGRKNFVDGSRTWQTATFSVSGDRFMAIGLCFRNTAGAAKHQAVALRVKSDMSVFLNCRMEGYQDTLYAQVYRQFYRGCIISGTVDFIFGDASAIFQNCVLIVRRPLANQQNIITAHGRIQRRQKTGFVIQRCRILPDAALSKPNAAAAAGTSIRSYLGRPWKEYARTVIMESHIGGFIHPDGYMPWDGNFALSTLYYAEFNNIGGGANLSDRVTWPGFHVIDRKEAERYTPENFLYGSSWIPATGAPVKLGMYTH